MRKVVKWLGGTLLTLVALFVAAVLILSRRTFDAPYPDIKASSDPKMIERGRYIVYGPAHCVACHVDKQEQERAKNGETPLLAGGAIFHFPLGNFHTPNLTPDRETGIGRYTDAELARVLRYNVRPDGRAVLPFMEYHDMSDEDITAVISFLRAQPAVRRAIPQHELTFLGKAVMAFLIKPRGPSAEPPKTSPAEEVTIARGAYVANNVAGCDACHTRRSQVDGSYIASTYSGGSVFRVDDKNVLVTPNLTPSKTGRITSWDEEQFVGRFGVGMGLPGTHMPWRMYQRMSETDVRAVYRYLRSLPPSEFDPGPSKQVRQKKS